MQGGDETEALTFIQDACQILQMTQKVLFLFVAGLCFASCLV